MRWGYRGHWAGCVQDGTAWPHERLCAMLGAGPRDYVSTALRLQPGTLQKGLSRQVSGADTDVGMARSTCPITCGTKRRCARMRRCSGELRQAAMKSARQET